MSQGSSGAEPSLGPQDRVSLDFYVLQDVDRNAMLRFACRLAAKAVRTSQPIYVHAASAEQAREFDELLWCYPPGRMIPHGIVGSTEAVGAPVLIGHAAELGEDMAVDGLLINLTDEPPAFVGRFARAAEIVVEQTRASGRMRYKHYREQGYPLKHHEIGDWEGG